MRVYLQRLHWLALRGKGEVRYCLVHRASEACQEGKWVWAFGVGVVRWAG